MERVIVAVIVVFGAAVVAAVLSRRTRPAVATAPEHHVPTSLDRADFTGPDQPWLVVVFTAATCSSCAETWDRARHLASPAVAVQEVEVGAEPELHRRYGIDAVPTTVVVDDGGQVRRSFLGPVTTTHLWAAVADLREPGSVPEDCEGD